ncbi:DNA-binding CsgD family transcriptional regulator [Actinoplanes octamycinicus]|uniref:DNA-binding CsgD family transcriptional regulator n=1 Tax=Actinoplanes octamycinicus TaxID=135948 RepID=A0A7W7MA83_9ACTN|nr:LuxR C-terminal-related transcriptional regulator [Actinoplanes octamycinicus]MBB4742651.1 DNA-binding CsgD family transcriptional regulator [Actinoplanes octamycinicus]
MNHEAGRWLDIIGSLLREPLTDFPHDRLLRQLITTFAAGSGCWTYRTPGGSLGGMKLHPGFSRAAWLTFVDGRLHEHPLVRWFSVTGQSAAWTVARVPACLVDRRYGEWRERTESFGLRHQMAVPIFYGPAAMAVFVVARQDEDFTDGDVHLAHRLQPLLTGVARQARVLARLAPESSAAGRQADVTLTGRETAVLALTAHGLTAVAVSHRLGVSPRTVHKHLEHIYAKLRTRDRLSAVLKAGRLGLLPDADRTEY